MTLEELIVRYPSNWEKDKDTDGWTNMFKVNPEVRAGVTSNEGKYVSFAEISSAISEYLTRDLKFKRVQSQSYWEIMTNEGDFTWSFGNALKGMFSFVPVKNRVDDNVKLEKPLVDVFGSDDFWKQFFEKNVYSIITGSNIEIGASILLWDSADSPSDMFSQHGQITNYQKITTDGEVTGYWVGVNFSNLKKVFDSFVKNGFAIEFHGSLRKKDQPIVEILYHSTVGNYKDLPPGDEKDVALKGIEDEIKKSVENGDYESYSIQDFGNYTRLITTPYIKEPYSLNTKIIEVR